MKPLRKQPDLMFKGEGVEIYKSTGSRDIVSFSPLNVPLGRFTPFTAIFSGARRIAFVNTGKNDWYLNGHPGLGSDLPQAAGHLGKLLDQYGFENPLFYGSSMGAFGAFLYAARLPSLNPSCLLLAPEIALGVPEGVACNHLTAKQIKTGKALWSWSAERMALDKVTTVFGQENLADYYCAATAWMNFGMNPVMLENCGHVAPTFVDKMVGLATFIENPCARNSPIKWARISEQFDPKDFETLKSIIDGFTDQSHVLARMENIKSPGVRDVVNLRAAFRWPYIFEALKFSDPESTAYQKARILACRGVVNIPSTLLNDFEFVLLSLTQHRRGNIRLSLKSLKEMIKMYPFNPDVQECLTQAEKNMETQPDRTLPPCSPPQNSFICGDEDVQQYRGAAMDGYLIAKVFEELATLEGLRTPEGYWGDSKAPDLEFTLQRAIRIVRRSKAAIESEVAD